jgi:HAD superfamily 5'-nucleotidase-like hydrolase
MSIYANRTLNLKKIRAIGFDMDYTIVRYHTHAFEKLTFRTVIDKLITLKKYPEGIRRLHFDLNMAIRGLVLDTSQGNILKIGSHGKVKQAFHGTRPLDFKTQQLYYRSLYVDLADTNFTCVDTAFAFSNVILFMNLVDYRDAHPENMPSYKVIEEDIGELVSLAHSDGSLKDCVKRDPLTYVVKDPDIVKALECLKSDGKKLLLITNSDFDYTRFLMETTCDPFLKYHKSWYELFDITVTNAQKPRFFTDNLPFLSIDPATGLMSNAKGPIEKGVYQGGNARKLESDLHFSGEDFLYVGDHIFGDVLTLKKNLNWRTALVIEEIEAELEALKKGRPLEDEITTLMRDKIRLENEMDAIYLDVSKKDRSQRKEERSGLRDELRQLDEKIAPLIVKNQSLYNPLWGEIMRAGQEESRLATQIEKYACIYLARVSDFNAYSPKRYFRPFKRPLPHEHF